MQKIKLNNMQKILCLILIILLVILALLICIKGNKITIEIKNWQNNIELNENFQETKATAKACRFLKCKDITNLVKSKNNVDTTKLGEYKVTYEVKYKNKTKKIDKIVNVIDSIPPKIELSGDKEITICPNTIYKDEGYKAIDNYDGDITDKINIQEKENKITYSIIDSSKNETKTERIITKEDKENPIITIKGPTKVKIALNEEYKDPGATATDNCTKDLTNKITITNNIDNKNKGNYNITYSVTDESGNTTQAIRYVEVIDKEINIPGDKENYIKYLENYIKNSNYKVSIGYVNLNTGYTYTYSGSKVYFGASLVKTVDAMYVYEKMPNFSNKTKENVKNAISVSNNNAHIALVDEIGFNNLKQYGLSLGATNFFTSGTNKYYANTSVNDQIAIWKHLYQVINTNPKGEELKSYFVNTYSNNLRFDGCPTIMHKYGYSGNYYHEAGLVYTKNPYIVVILTMHGKNNFKSVVKDLSQKIYQFNQIES